MGPQSAHSALVLGSASAGADGIVTQFSLLEEFLDELLRDRGLLSSKAPNKQVLFKIEYPVSLAICGVTEVKGQQFDRAVEQVKAPLLAVSNAPSDGGSPVRDETMEADH